MKHKHKVAANSQKRQQQQQEQKQDEEIARDVQMNERNVNQNEKLNNEEKRNGMPNMKRIGRVYSVCTNVLCNTVNELR